MKNLWKDKRIKGAVALIVIVGVINSVGVINLSMKGQRAQLFGASSSVMKPFTVTYGPGGNALGQTGITFTQNKVVTVTACSGGGGGGGGDHGYENGSDDGAGGAGGGGGGKGNCASRTIKLRSKDTLRWLVGGGGSGGLKGLFKEAMDFGPPVDQHTIATNGGDGGWTWVSVNYLDIMALPGGNGGLAGTHATGLSLPGWGGAGGSIDESLQQAWEHRGEDGQNTGEQITPLGSSGNGGYGGNGEGQSGLLSNRGTGGTVYNPFSHGSDGLTGATASGGGGGGGGPGRWEDIDSNDDNYANTFRNWGGFGGWGGDGYITISW